ncbi:hypothetical protein COCVIDRAFT_42925 [Bipolaris victoriae FI3]|uniref:Heterokaryon incompatibility domain-containing protein n=1 Tax=Bipolaris victoriae (strain FI3) TaxID=930091 RepID=W7DY81_BIPV3|nr:hypothetical protein COCVIDRAFT_42925 [Bipolaris victoriae FI3]
MSNYSIYTERILNSRIFRLLFIRPALDQDQQLECYCLPFNIDYAPPYEALSYVWGKSNLSAEIRCNGRPITIGIELLNALIRLRSPEVTQIIWADALCINQSDKAEKSHQVPLMGSIYSSAKRVVVWLGQGDEKYIIEAFEYSTEVAKACLRYDEERGLPLNHEERYETLDFPKDAFPPSAWKSLQELYERPWFSRVWCVQEIRLAQAAFVLWGDFGIDWQYLSLAASWVFDKSDQETDFEVPSAVGQSVSHPDILRDKYRYPLLEALQAFREFESTDPRDKVYGLLNLVENQSEIDALALDYHKSVGEVYADTVLAIIRVHSRLSTFGYITHPPKYDPDNEENLKCRCRSWAPRWDDSAVADVLGFSENDCRWKPYGDNATVMIAGHDSRPEELCLKGVYYNRVCSVEGIMDYYNLKDPMYNDENPASPEDDDMIIETDSESDDSDPLLDIFNKFFVESSSEAVHRAWARTLTAGCWDKNQDYIENLDPATQESYYRAYPRFMRRLKEFQVTGTEGNFAHDEDSAKFQRTVYSICRQRRVFWTDNMTFGLGPQYKYLFMGQAYVDNIMHGEIFDGSEEYEERTFCLI